jgi:hypothetical protein
VGVREAVLEPESLPVREGLAAGVWLPLVVLEGVGVGESEGVVLPLAPGDSVPVGDAVLLGVCEGVGEREGVRERLGVREGLAPGESVPVGVGVREGGAPGRGVAPGEGAPPPALGAKEAEAARLGA